MKIKYTIIWIDDTPDWVSPIRSTIESHIEDLDLDANIIFETNGDNLVGHIHNNSVDLLIVDHNLPNVNGDDLIRQVRALGCLTEIIFYSQELENCTPFDSWQSVHVTHRDEADDKISELVSHFSRIINDISLMRGVIITEAIDLENQISGIILKLFDNKADLFRGRILNERKLDFQSKWSFVNGYLKDTLKKLHAENGDEDKIQRLTVIKAILNTLIDDVGDPRNILAHSERDFNNQGQLELRGLNSRLSKITFDNDWKNKIRENIRKHRKNLYDVRELI